MDARASSGDCKQQIWFASGDFISNKVLLSYSSCKPEQCKAGGPMDQMCAGARETQSC